MGDTTLAKYTFLSHVRRGVATQIKEGTSRDDSGRATFDIVLNVKGRLLDLPGIDEAALETLIEYPEVKREIPLYGPGDVIGIHTKAIIKTAPVQGAKKFESNFLPFIEFYDADFPWRYTPEAPTAGRLTPWITLAVLKAGEFTENGVQPGAPLPSITVKNPAVVLPPSVELWAWAHVQINQGLLDTGSDGEVTAEDVVVVGQDDTIREKLQDLLDNNPDLAYSRLICPRKLDRDTEYHAFLIPTYESGRLAGLGQDNSIAGKAWGDSDTGDIEFPCYFRWQFTTSSSGDFEQLVKDLSAQPVPPEVGARPMDVSQPHEFLPGITENNGILQLGGALRVPFTNLDADAPAAFVKNDNWAPANPETPSYDFQQSLKEFINLSETYKEEETVQAAHEKVTEAGVDLTNFEDDPLVTPPLYGRWHAGVSKLRDSDNWIHELNLDPRHRATAGFGTGVIQTNQEKYMAAAWEQVGDILEANRRIRRSRMQAETAGSWHRRYFEQMPGNPVLADLAFWVTAPLHSRILTTENKTLAHHIRQSAIPPVMLSATVRRTLRPRARVARHLAGAGARGITGLLAGLNEGALNAAPPRTVPAGLLTIRHFAETIKPVGAPSWILQALSRYPWFKYTPLAIGAVVAVVLIVLVSALPLLVAGVALAGGLGWAGYRRLVRWERQQRAAQFLTETNLRPRAVDDLPKSPNFRISEPGSGFRPRQGNTDSEEAKRFKQALRNAFEAIEKVTAAPPEKAAVQLPFQSIVSQVVSAVKPAVTIPKRLHSQLMIPAHVQKFIGEAEGLEEIMAYPEFDLPMYKPLAAISHDLFLPRMHYIPKSSITLLETNQKFIEAYLVGLNHEFGRELLWREYPTDQRGSYFRQFWGVTDALKPFSTIEKDIRVEYADDIASLSDEKAKSRFVREKVISRRRAEVEKARDIPPIHEWDAASKLGSHDYREASGDAEEELVLVIRGELLERYPNAVIFAQKAKKEEGSFVLADPTEENIKTPMYEARVENVPPPPETESRNGAAAESPQRNIYLFGFDLTAEEAKGSDTDPGWFFVIQERPGEPRFGLDMPPENNGNDLFVWNDLDWGDVTYTGGGFINVGGTTSPSLPGSYNAGSDDNKQNQYDEDINVQWNGGNSAHFAYILYQAPVMFAYHASEMLKPKEENEL